MPAGHSELGEAPVPQHAQSALAVLASVSHTDPKRWQKRCHTSFLSRNQQLSFTVPFPSKQQGCTEGTPCPSGLTNPSGLTGQPCPLLLGLHRDRAAGLGSAEGWKLNTAHFSSSWTTLLWNGHCSLVTKHGTNVCENLRKLIKAAPKFQSDSGTFMLFLDSLLDFIKYMKYLKTFS